MFSFLCGGGKCSQQFQDIGVRVCFCMLVSVIVQRTQCARSQQKSLTMLTNNTMISASINASLTTDTALWTDTPHKHTTLFVCALNNNHYGFQSLSVSFVKAVTEIVFLVAGTAERCCMNEAISIDNQTND